MSNINTKNQTSAPATPQPTTEAISPNQIINQLNHLHFAGHEIQLHAQDGRLLSRGQIAECLDENSYRFKGEPDAELPEKLNIVINDGRWLTYVPISMQQQQFCISGEASRFSRRRSIRQPTANLQASISSAKQRLQGCVVDFSAEAIRIELQSDLREGQRFNSCLYRDQTLVYQGPGTVIRQQDGQLVMQPLPQPQQNHQQRMNRPKPSPAPTARFNHPFTGQTINLDLIDISPTGFAASLPQAHSLICINMILPELEIIFSEDIAIRCSAKVAYAAPSQGDEIQYGFNILDMDFEAYQKLAKLVAASQDVQAHILSKVDMESLWEFFFASRFIYPTKYKLLNRMTDQLKNSFDTLYNQANNIFTHIIYKKNSRIFGHISLIKAYPGVWMVQHLGALKDCGIHNGLKIIDQCANYLDGLYRLPSTGLDYLMFSYRPQNPFPDYFFGGACRYINDRSLCSLDLMRYHYCQASREKLPAGWQIEDYGPAEMQQLQKFYGQGLLLDALGLSDPYSDFEDREFWQCNLLREKRTYCLKQADQLKAVFIVDRSAPGANLSELLNCIKALVVDELPQEIFQTALGNLSRIYRQQKTPVLTYPSEYGAQDAPEKFYQLFLMKRAAGVSFNTFLKNEINPRLQQGN